MINNCPECLKKQQVIDRLIEENQGLKHKLHYQERKEKEGLFGSSTPSSRVPIKPNTSNEKKRKQRGAKPGHKGIGRKVFHVSEADRVVDVELKVGYQCPDCGHLLEDKGLEERPVIESRPLKAERVIFRLPKRYCPQCHRVFKARPPGVLPRSLYGNRLITQAALRNGPARYSHGACL